MRSLRSIRPRMAVLGTILVAFCGTSRGEDDLPELTKECGPYMVRAYNFRGPEAEQFAKTLAKELRKDHDLPSFVYESHAKNGSPEFAVLVGDCKTSREAFDLHRRVKKIKAKCLANTASPSKGRGLSRAMTTANPLVKLD